MSDDMCELMSDSPPKRSQGEYGVYDDACLQRNRIRRGLIPLLVTEIVDTFASGAKGEFWTS